MFEPRVPQLAVFFSCFAWDIRVHGRRLDTSNAPATFPSHTDYQETSQPATTALQSMGVVLSETRPAPGCQGLS